MLNFCLCKHLYCKLSLQWIRNEGANGPIIYHVASGPKVPDICHIIRRCLPGTSFRRYCNSFAQTSCKWVASGSQVGRNRINIIPKSTRKEREMSAKWTRQTSWGPVMYSLTIYVQVIITSLLYLCYVIVTSSLSYFNVFDCNDVNLRRFQRQKNSFG